MLTEWKLKLFKWKRIIMRNMALQFTKLNFPTHSNQFWNRHNSSWSAGPLPIWSAASRCQKSACRHDAVLAAKILHIQPACSCCRSPCLCPAAQVFVERIFFQCMELYALVVAAAQESRWRWEMCSCLKLNAKVLSDTGFWVNFATVCLDIWWWWLIMDRAIVINMMYSAHWTSLACYIKLLMGCITKFNSNM